MNSGRAAALTALLQVEENEGYSNIVIDKAIRKHELEKKDAALATAIFYGVLERRITLDYLLSKFSKLPLNNLSPEVLNILRIGVYQILYLEKIPHSAAVNEAVNAASGNKKLEKAKGFINGVLRSLVRSLDHLPYPDEKRSPKKALSVKYSIPEWLLTLWGNSYGKNTALQMAEALQKRLPVYARVNTTKISTEALLQRLEERGRNRLESRPLIGCHCAERNRCRRSFEQLPRGIVPYSRFVLSALLPFACAKVGRTSSGFMRCARRQNLYHGRIDGGNGNRSFL